ncbi:DUF2232 domain-containing protein [bacterium]|jgi:uncharacterized protein YybS (DUF2232 family)|nr:DUF2232 domain-containing protein [bacterium]
MRHQNLALSRSALLVALTVAIFALLPFPVLGMAASLLLPVPLILLGVSHGTKYLWMGLLGVMILISMFFGPLSLFLYIPLGACSLALGWCFLKQYSIGKVLIFGWLAVGAAGFLDFTVGSQLAGVDPEKELATLKENFLSYFEKNLLEPAKKGRLRLEQEYQELSTVVTASIEEIDAKKKELGSYVEMEDKSQRMMEQIHILMKNPYPIFGFWIVVFLILEVLLARYFIHRFRFGEVPPIEFSKWKCPGMISWIFLLLMLGNVYFQDSGILSNEDWVLGFSYTMHMVYFVFGLSFISFFMLRWKLSVPLRVALFFLSFMFMQVLVFIGIFDSLFNVRKNHINGSERA